MRKLLMLVAVAAGFAAWGDWAVDVRRCTISDAQGNEYPWAAAFAGKIKIDGTVRVGKDRLVRVSLKRYS